MTKSIGSSTKKQNVPNLLNSVCEKIRKQWDRYSIFFNNDDFISYDMIWNAWCDKFSVNRNDDKIKLLYNFISGNIVRNTKNIQIKIINDRRTLILENLSNHQRYLYHLLCDNLGLYHESKTYGRRKKRYLHITKPDIWLWEFTTPNPSSKPRAFYDEQRKRMIEEKRNYKTERLRNTFCDECHQNGYDVELFCSVYVRGIYCLDCLDCVSDGNGDLLSCHKFEPIPW